ncbi:MAG: hypothetical protein AAGU14_03710 [Eubacteriaceae bacterium]
MKFDNINVPNFLEFAESLKLVRKAEIEIDDTNIINDVYTDLLPNNSIITKFNLPRTSILIGRKGTGKSTIIQKSIKDIKDIKNVIGIYIDVKTLYDSATPSLISDNTLITPHLEGEIVKYFIYKNFLKEVINKTKKCIKDLVDNSDILTKTAHYFLGKEDLINSVLKKITDSTDEVFKEIDLSLCTSIRTSIESGSNNTDKLSVRLSANPALGINSSDNNFEKFKKEFDSTILKYLDIKNCLIDNFLEIRKVTGLKYIYIYLDDYSEIDEIAQKLFMDWFVAPLNNLSEDFIKFKIATYPNRFYSGKLDNQKYDEINLDFYSALYTYKDISRMEEIATDYIKRLIANRFKVYLHGKAIKDYFDITEDELWDLLFEVSINNPRKIGYILSYCYETHLVYGKKITSAAISSGALRYFEEVIQKYFESNKYVLRSFNDMASIENQKELIEKIINKQVENKSLISKSTAKKFKIPSPPTSHFFVANQLSNLLDSLELNGYITTYNKLNDKCNIPSTLYSIDYGFCRKHNLSFGRPKDTYLRKYYNDHRFIFNALIKEHFNNSQVIICDNGHEFPFEFLQELEKYGMNCPECIKQRIFSTCHVEVSNKAILDKIKSYESNNIRLDDDIEYKILDFLNRNKDNSYSANEISQELDCSWQLVNKRADKLLSKSLLELDAKNGQQRRYYKITQSTAKILENS